jgi:hypothetical protein
VAERARATIPWLLVAGSVLFLVLVLYVTFGAYVPAKRRVARLEAELRQIYLREADLQTQLAQQEQRAALRERTLSAERDELARRLAELQTQLPTPTKSP